MKITCTELLLDMLAVVGFVYLYVHFTVLTSHVIADRFVPQRVDWESKSRRSLPVERPRTNGKFVVHEWVNTCEGSQLQSLKRSPIFPKYPNSHNFLYESRLDSVSRALKRRISGYLNAPETGYYVFRLASRGEAELWLSQTESHESLSLRASVGTHSGIDGHRSSQIFMDERKHYPIEILNAGDSVDVRWLQPGKHEFDIIGGHHISHDTNSLTHEVLPAVLVKDQNANDESFVKFNFVAFLTPWMRNSAISKCAIGFSSKRFVKSSSHLGEDFKANVEVAYSDGRDNKLQQWRERVDVNRLVQFYMNGLERIFPKKYVVTRVYRIEKFSHTRNPLYLMQLQFTVDGLDYPERVVEYVYQRNASHFCYPNSLTWNRDAHVNIVVAVSDDTKWIRLFIDQFERAFEEALEVDMHLIVVVYNKTGIDIEAILSKTSLVNRFTVLRLDGVFSRSRALNKGASLAKGVHPIILACDVHVHVPRTLFEDARTHCIVGRMAFAPILFQLGCGSQPGTELQKGSWCLQGYHVIGMSKTDWDKLSGFDETVLDQKVDWDLVQRMKHAGISVARFQYPGIYRHFIPKTSEPELSSSSPSEFGYLAKDV